MTDLKDLIWSSIRRLDRWISANGWAGHDPYDLYGEPFVMRPDGFYQKLLRRLLLPTEQLFPGLCRQIAGVDKRISPYGMGLFAEGYRLLHEATKTTRFGQRAEDALDILEQHRSKGWKNYCWGSPFDWQARILIPRDTPCGVVSTTAGHAFLGFYRQTGNTRYLDICRSICSFLVDDLHIDRLGNGQICFSYAPQDTFHIHNANLMAAEFLLAIDRELGNGTYAELAMQAVSYTLSEQNDDGSICYWGRDQADTCHIDHYHCGFEIRSLYNIWKISGDNRIGKAVERYFQYFTTELFQDSRIPKLMPTSTFPINIYSCAEAIFCNSLLAPDFPEAHSLLSTCVPWIISHMQRRDGAFIYMIKRYHGNLPWKLRIPYIRWGQATMLRALAQSAIALDAAR